MESKGVIIGSNEKLAWLIPWFWKHYSKHNDYEVIIIDFGLSEKSRDLCSSFGKVVKLSEYKDFVTPKTQIDPIYVKKWEDIYGESVWSARQAWFLKPLALLQTSFDKTIWLDLDCEVCSPLEPLFQHLDDSSEFCVAKDPGREGIYNSGVVVYRKNSKLLEEWAKCCKSQNDRFLGDDYVLSSLINSEKRQIKQLPDKHHWIPGELSTDALIIHWVSNWGKQFIEMYGGYQGYKDYLLKQS